MDKRIKATEPTVKRIQTSEPTVRRLDPQTVAEALAGEPVPGHVEGRPGPLTLHVLRGELLRRGDHQEEKGMAPTLTYGRLYDKLAGLGYNQRKLALNGKTVQVFEHKTIDNAMLVLPDNDPKEPVDPFDVRSVLAYLQSRGVVSEHNPFLD